VDATQADDLVGAAVAIAHTDGVKAIGLAPVTAAGPGPAVALTVGRALWRRRVAAGGDPVPVVTSASRPAGRLAPQLVGLPHEVMISGQGGAQINTVWEVIPVGRIADVLASLRPGAAAWLPEGAA
jgi:hypothetical protein